MKHLKSYKIFVIKETLSKYTELRKPLPTDFESTKHTMEGCKKLCFKY